MNYVHFELANNSSFTDSKKYGSNAIYNDAFYKDIGAECDSLNFTLTNNRYRAEWGDIKIPTAEFMSDFNVSITNTMRRKYYLKIYLDATNELLYQGLAIIYDMQEDFTLLKIKEDADETDLLTKLKTVVTEGKPQDIFRPYVIGRPVHCAPVTYQAKEFIYTVEGKVTGVYVGGMGQGEIAHGEARWVAWERYASTDESKKFLFKLKSNPYKTVSFNAENIYGSHTWDAYQTPVWSTQGSVEQIITPTGSTSITKDANGNITSITVTDPSGTKKDNSSIATNATVTATVNDAIAPINNSLSSKLEAGSSYALRGVVSINDIAGAIKTSGVNYNTTTGAVSGTGVILTNGGLVGVKNGATTFSITTMGDAVFKGVVDATGGSFGNLKMNYPYVDLSGVYYTNSLHILDSTDMVKLSITNGVPTANAIRIKNTAYNSNTILMELNSSNQAGVLIHHNDPTRGGITGLRCVLNGFNSTGIDISCSQVDSIPVKLTAGHPLAPALYIVQGKILTDGQIDVRNDLYVTGRIYEGGRTLNAKYAPIDFTIGDKQVYAGGSNKTLQQHLDAIYSALNGKASSTHRHTMNPADWQYTEWVKTDSDGDIYSDWHIKVHQTITTSTPI